MDGFVFECWYYSFAAIFCKEVQCRASLAGEVRTVEATLMAFIGGF